MKSLPVAAPNIIYNISQYMINGYQYQDHVHCFINTMILVRSRLIYLYGAFALVAAVGVWLGQGGSQAGRSRPVDAAAFAKNER